MWKANILQENNKCPTCSPHTRALVLKMSSLWLDTSMQIYIHICKYIHIYDLHLENNQCVLSVKISHELLHFKAFLSSLFYFVPFFCNIRATFSAVGVINNPTQTAGHQAQNVTRASDCLQSKLWQPRLYLWPLLECPYWSQFCLSFLLAMTL